MKTGLTKKQKVTELYFNAKDPQAEVYTHDTKLKRRLLEYAAKFPELCQLSTMKQQLLSVRSSHGAWKGMVLLRLPTS